MTKIKNKILIIGLGYVGLPLCVEFHKKSLNVSGFDSDHEYINQLSKSNDTKNIIKNDRKYLSNINFSTNIKNFSDHNIFIITVPTPIFKNKKPNLRYVIKALESISLVIKKNDTVILESTVYPGFSEDIIYPYFKKKLNLDVNKDYFYGYSPERINPSDKINNLTNINKIISSENNQTVKLMKDIYGKIVKAKLHITKSIKVAEAAKVVENTQRDINISLMNELSIIFDKLNIDTLEVLQAASTKWNFHKYKPGLVGGHCIGVDPYYLSYKSNMVGYRPNVILAGRKINDQLPLNIIQRINSKILLRRNFKLKRVLFLGLTFKENCNDTRNSGSIKLLNKIQNNFPKAIIDIIDPYVSKNEFYNTSRLEIKKFSAIKNYKYQLIVIAVAHQYFKLKINKIIANNSYNNSIIVDLKSILPKNMSDFRL